MDTSELLREYAFKNGQMLEWIQAQHEPDHDDGPAVDCDVCQFLERLALPEQREAPKAALRPRGKRGRQ